MIYLDHNATTPPHPSVLAAMAEAQAHAWANPSSTHRSGQQARALLDRARAAVACLVGRDARDVVLTSGGTEANNMALRAPFASGRRGGVVASRIEHPSVVRTVEALERDGVPVEWVRPEPSGVVAVEAVAAAMEALGDVAMVALMAVNHETGVVQPVRQVAELARERGGWLHVDAVQAVGRLETECWAGADSLAVAAHKIRGPKGIGALVTRPGVELQPLLTGGEQERGLRPGTQSASLAVGFAVAAERAHDGGVARHQPLGAWRDDLEARLMALGQAKNIRVQRNGDGPRAPHVSNLSWGGWRAAELCAALDLEGVAVSAGSACSAGTAEPSKVVAAMLGAARAGSAVRISLGEDTRERELERACSAFERVIGRHSTAR